MARTHRLKTWPEFFEAIKSGAKTFELREDDRGFAVGDELNLLEWEPHFAGMNSGRYTDRELTVTVTYKLPGGRFGLDPHWCILGFAKDAK